MGKIRQKRVEEGLRSEIMDLLHTALRDPRLSLITVTAVDIDRELQVANVFVTKFGDEADRREILHTLDGAKGFLRHELAQRIHLKTVPELRFHWDASLERGERISHLIDQLESEDDGKES